MNKSIIFLLCLAASVISVDPPLWPETFSQDYVVSQTNVKIFSFGKIWYDIKNNLERVDIKDARINEICNTVGQNQPGSCTQINKNGNLYVWLPEKNQCCRYCTAAQGCVIPTRDWLKSFKYAGEATLSGQKFYKWTYTSKDSNVENYYATEDDARIPRRIEYSTYHYDMIMNTYSTAPIEAVTFNLPSYCNSDCPKKGSVGKSLP